MGRVSDWVLGMEEDASWMSKAVFINVHGITNADVWDKVQREDVEDFEPDLDGYEAMREGYHG